MLNVYSLGRRALAIQALAASTAPAVPAPVDHVVVIDISGSMYHDLPNLRAQLKNKLASLVKERDTVSIIWFSGRGQCGVLVEGLAVRTVTDLSELHRSIDRFLQPQGLTGFKEPLQSALAVFERLGKKNPGHACSLFFMTDGYDNQWSDSEILAVCGQLAARVDNAVIVEYGWHCNRELLTEMAATLGGKLIFSQDLQSYQVNFESELSRGIGGKRIAVKLGATASAGYAYVLKDGAVTSVVPDAAGVVMVPQDTQAVAYFTTGAAKPQGYDSRKGFAGDELLWSALVAAAQRMDTETVFEVLRALGDVNLAEIFTNCFSKEDYNLFQVFALDAATNRDKRFAGGYDPNAVPREDAYSVLHLLADLAADENCLLYPYHPDFKYERIGAASKQREEGVSFKIADRSAGYPLQDLVWTEDRPNVSVRVRVPGFAVLPADRPAPLPVEVDSYIYRNYTIVRDGIVHTRVLPVSMSQATFANLQAQGLLAGESWAPGKVLSLSFPRLPVINRQMVRGVTAADTFAKVLELAQLKGTQKVFNDLLTKVAPKESKVFQARYGDTATAWLAERGVTDYNGFNPPSDTVKTGDFYVAKELKIAAKGLSSLPKVADVEASLAAGKKLKVGEAVMAPAVRKVQAFLASPIYQEAADQPGLLAGWVRGEQKAAVAAARKLTAELAQRKFAIVVGHTWFVDKTGLDDNSAEASLAGFGPVQVTATLSNVQIEK